MKAQFKKVSTQVFEAYVKPLSTNSEGENMPCEFSDATGIVNMVLRSGLIQDLLYEFWQRTSDACPLEAAEAEKQEQEFSEWVKELDVIIP